MRSFLNDLLYVLSALLDGWRLAGVIGQRQAIVLRHRLDLHQLLVGQRRRLAERAAAGEVALEAGLHERARLQQRHDLLRLGLQLVVDHHLLLEALELGQRRARRAHALLVQARVVGAVLVVVRALLAAAARHFLLEAFELRQRRVRARLGAALALPSPLRLQRSLHRLKLGQR